MDGSIGRPVVRRDAAAKATGVARYAADFPHADTAYAAIATSPIARGRMTRIDTAAAEAVPGVRLVLTHRSLNATLNGETFIMKGGHMQSSFMPLSSDQVHYAGQIVSLIVADTQEAAEEAARKVEIDYQAEHASAAIDDPDRIETRLADKSIDKGDAEAAFDAAPVKIDATYLTPAQHHNPIELYATSAVWRDDTLLVNVPSQWVVGTQAGLATIFGIPMADIKVESPFVGGGFGGKATILPHTVLVAMAARRLGRPVKLVVPREAMFTVGSFRPATRSRVRLAAERDGTLTAVLHDEAGQTAAIDHIAFAGTAITARMYASPNIRMRETTIATDVNTPGFQRAPAEAPGFFGFESAVDELAVALAMDPIELRIRNEPARDPVSDLPWSSRSLVQCYRRGAELFGWDRRTPGVGSMTAADGTLIGWGCATATYPSAMAPSSARVRLNADGTCIVSCAAHDLGTGAYTVLGQVAADVLHVSDELVRVHLGDTTLPSGSMAGGSVTTGSSGSAVHMAATAVRDRLFQAVSGSGDTAGFTIADGHVVGPDGSRHRIAQVLGNSPGGFIEETANWKPTGMDDRSMRRGLAGGMAFAGPVTATHVSHSFGAQFAEVRIDPLLRTVKVSRMVGVFACGRIINPRTAHSNLAGGMIWGASFALLEETRVDRPRARFANTDLAGYHVSTNADIGDVIVETLDEHDTVVNAIGAKAVGEVSIVGMPAAIANAIYHATGIRVRKTPILVEDLLG
ncbi:xanthine dehydrogenase family protein molybdopterin-binding subunit [Lichenicola cladoniae]|uniref:Xanthine dehydrogenase family protein molybdopterin-binding subunit n=1 Tax=Lichenicola cladoniae TaxID=1484109 RepID=A0A6M8HTY9_9PROT|nr:xanthine dehydrogenase family protein molybdopterin-binding subunit [Lichenicola cladoniae]NPD67702.1 xanthine dehydrogenase family protein molybdopterin-binding subunit [Acetobacteraceae bacterium]QKE91637.1 xanthine dehydrogenase family protein molybdopterin-binding subunit [Lichenicola cladoniae]